MSFLIDWYQSVHIKKRLSHNIIADVDVPICRKPCSKPAVERILEFGRELYSMSQRLKLEHCSAASNEKMLEVSKRGIFILLVYNFGCLVRILL